MTVTWSEVPDHVKLTGTDHQIKRDAGQVTVIMINLLYTPPALSKNFEINILDQLFLRNVYLLYIDLL